MNNLICIGVQVERLQGIINKLTAENVGYRDNNKTQEFEVRIQELQQMLKQTGELLNLLLREGLLRERRCVYIECILLRLLLNHMLLARQTQLRQVLCLISKSLQQGSCC